METAPVGKRTVGGFRKGGTLFSVESVEEHGPHKPGRETEITLLPSRKRPRMHGGDNGYPSVLYSSLIGGGGGAGAVLKVEPDEGAYVCQVCHERITSDRKVHETSTLHVFNARRKLGTRRVMLPDSNVGMQILTRLGWREEEGGGLGLNEQGKVQPVKSTLKLDRTGLGAKQYQARVTHFPAHDVDQARRAPDGKSAAEKAHEELEKLRAEERKRVSRVTREGAVFETRRERNERIVKEKKDREKIRRQLHSDIPDEYEHFFE